MDLGHRVPKEDKHAYEAEAPMYQRKKKQNLVVEDGDAILVNRVWKALEENRVHVP